MNEIFTTALLCVLTEEQMARFKDVAVALTGNAEPNGTPEEKEQAQIRLQQAIAEIDRTVQQALRLRKVLSQSGLPPLRLAPEQRRPG